MEVADALQNTNEWELQMTQRWGIKSRYFLKQFASNLQLQVTAARCDIAVPHW